MITPPAGARPPYRFRPEHQASDEDLMRFCAANGIARVEREANGEIVVMSPAGNRTGRRNAAIIAALDAWAQQDARGYVFDSSTGFTLPDGSLRSPDAAWIERTRWDALPEDEKNRFSRICPDFVLELRSPTDALHDLERKMHLWIANGVHLAWLIDPAHRTVTIYRPNTTPETLHAPTDAPGNGILHGFTLPLHRIWE
jgi:Uma2 family endonuclease